VQRLEYANWLHDQLKLSIRRACSCVGLSRAAFYEPSLDWTVRDAAVIAALSEQVSRHPSQGFWKYHERLRRQGHRWNHKRTHRVYSAMHLNLRRAAKRRLPARMKKALYVPNYPDSVWSADFMSDALCCGRRFRTFNITDDFNRECVHIEIDTSISSARLVRVFEQIKAQRPLPEVLRTDNGPEFLGDVFVQWAKANGMAIQYIQPGKPNQNAFIERFNRSYREELLNVYLFKNLDHVRQATHLWIMDYNQHRPHDALGNMTPIEYRNHHAKNSSLKLSA